VDVLTNSAAMERAGWRTQEAVLSRSGAHQKPAPSGLSR